MQKALADLSLWYDDWLKLDNNYSSWKNYCKISWRINELKVDIDKNSECLWYFSLIVNKINIHSYWVQNWDENRNCWKEVWLYKKINWKAYIPQPWDNLVAKINPENNYISELYLMNWKSWNEINDFAKTLNLPYCSWNTITQEPEKTPQNNSNYYLYWSLILAFIIIWVLVFKLLKFKK